MSGICGVVDWTRTEDLRRAVEVMLTAGRHRGPDGVNLHTAGEAAVGHLLLRTRPPALDPPQPLADTDHGLWIVLDGTIFNRDEIIASTGSRGRGVSDAQLFLDAYRADGPDCLKRIDGIFAVAIWDARRRTLFCARDPMGIKPFFYARWGRSFVFGSELPQILALPGFIRKPNEAMIGMFLATDVDLETDTFFEGVYRLSAGTHATVTDTGMQTTRYWDLDPAYRVRLPSDDAYGERFRELFERAVAKNLETSVPLGANLSGGLDTSSIVCMADQLKRRAGASAPLDTFSMAFDEKACDERPFIQAVRSVARVNHHQYLADSDDVFRHIPEVQDRQAEPFRSIGVVLFWRLKQLPAGKGIRILLSGMGADEVLGGLNLYYLADLVRTGRWASLPGVLRRLAELDPYGYRLGPGRLLLKFGIKPLIPGRIARLRKRYLHGAAVPDFIDGTFAKRTRLAERLFTDPPRRFRDMYRQSAYHGFRHTYTPHLMHYEDASNAAFGIEGRFPFLDRALVEYLFALPPDQKIRDGVPKIVLRNGLTGVLPDAIRARTDRGSISTLFDYWLGHQYHNEVAAALDGKRLRESGYFNLSRLQEIYTAHRAGKPARYTIWKAYNVAVWLERFFP